MGGPLPRRRPVWALGAALFLGCGTLLAALTWATDARGVLHDPVAHLADAIGTLVSLAWLGLGVACLAAALPSRAPPGKARREPTWDAGVRPQAW